MKSKVICNFIDNKIRSAICEKKSINELVVMLEERIISTSNSKTMRDAYKNFINDFSRKRINDMKFIQENEKFNRLSPNKVFKLILLKDKIIGPPKDEIVPVFRESPYDPTNLTSISNKISIDVKGHLKLLPRKAQSWTD